MTRNVARPIVALDVGNTADARRVVDLLGDACTFYKVGLELFTAEGPDVVRWLRDEGKDVFLDLKLFDIPNTVRGAARSAARMGVRLLTVHATGGRAMLEAAVQGADDAGANCGILAVTVLTSMDQAMLASAIGRDDVDVAEEVVRLARVASDAGVHGIVCSGQEVARVRTVAPGLWPLVPGVRLSGDHAHDQQRVVSPGEAQRAGAAYIVLGRTVTAAPDPREAMALVRAELS